MTLYREYSDELLDQISELTRERDEARAALAAEERRGEEARKAARWMLPFLVNLPHHLRTAVESWPWLDETERT